MISTIALRYFATVARCGSFRGAAEQLFVAPSAVSRQVSLIEEDLTSPLFERGRGRKGLKLTTAGEALMHYVITMENEERRVRSDIEALKGMRRGEVKFGAAETFSRVFVPSFLSAFNKDFPGITYNVSILPTPELVERVMNDDLDAALMFNPAATLGLHHIVEIQRRTALLVPKGHPLWSKKSVRISDCAEFGMAWPDDSITTKRFLDSIFARAKVRPRIVLVSNSFELLRNASMSGLSIAIVNDPLGPDSDNHDYRYIPIEDRYVENYRLTLSTHAGRNLSTASLSFIERLEVALEVTGAN